MRRMFYYTFASVAYLFKRSIAIIFIISKPNNHMSSFYIDFCHKQNLIIFFFLICLINADSVDPEKLVNNRDPKNEEAPYKYFR